MMPGMTHAAQRIGTCLVDNAETALTRMCHADRKFGSRIAQRLDWNIGALEGQGSR